ncbi:TetR/AcrR family transcriptional regulator [Paenibacillus sp. MMS18-CY102]|uniref:TetR/AcrR family transcriptional regulator n=1 Tax=Paenibacillus sp. MMS18-CY102 TaxID=2682849 RepID=UPI001F303B76|nr:TetR/AcrR family transcriptional regulator [Paenibacillus sp. MMS18-CY102]
MSRYEKRKQETKQKIADAALSLFTEHGFDQTTMEQIAEKADVAKGTLFNHFASKNALLSHFGEIRVQLIKTAVEQSVQGIDGVVNKLYAIFDALADVNEEDKPYGLLVVQDFMLRYTGGERRNYNEASAVIRAVIEQGIASGELRGDVDAQQAAALLGGVFFHTTVDWIRGNFSPPLREAFRGQLDIVFRGIQTTDH